MPGLAGRRALVRVSGVAVPFADEATTTADDQTYQITNSARRYWDRDTAIVVEEDGVATAESYTVNRLLGTVTFAAADVGRGVVTVSGAYLPTAVALGARAYSYQLVRTMLDDTDFDSANDESGFTSKIAGLLDASGTISRRLNADGTFFDALNAGAPVILEFWTNRNDANPSLVVWALLAKDGVQAAIEGNIDATLDWEGTADADGVVAAEPS